MNDWLPSVVASLLGFFAAWLAYRQSTRAVAARNKTEAAKVDAEAYGRAKILYESGIAQLERQVSDLRTQINNERTISDMLRVRVAELEETVARLRYQLILVGIDSTQEKGQ